MQQHNVLHLNAHYHATRISTTEVEVVFFGGGGKTLNSVFDEGLKSLLQLFKNLDTVYLSNAMVDSKKAKEYFKIYKT